MTIAEELAMLAVLLLCLGVVADGPAPNASELKCGPYCLYVALRALDLYPGTFTAFEKEADPPGPQGYSLLDIERLAQRRGATTRAIEADVDQLDQLTGRRVCIALMRKHFVIIKAIDRSSGQLTIIDPPYEYTRKIEQFEQRYSGKAVVISVGPLKTRWGTARVLIVGSLVGLVLVFGVFSWGRFSSRRRRRLLALLLLSPIGSGCDSGPRPATMPAASGTSLRIEPAEHHAGVIFLSEPDQKLKVTTFLHNDSEVPVKITGIQRSCNCTSNSLERSTIPPRSQARLDSEFALGQTPGPRRVSITLSTSDQPNEDHKVSFDWDLRTPLRLTPDACQFGRIDDDRPAIRSLDLRVTGLTPCRRCSVRCVSDHPLVSAAMDRTPFERFGERHEPAGPKPGEEFPLGMLTVSLMSGSGPGNHSQQIELFLECEGRHRSKLVFPVEWSIQPSFEFGPSRLWLGTINPGGRIARAVVIRSNDNVPFTLGSVRTDHCPFASRNEVGEQEGPARSLKLEFTAPMEPGLHRGTIEVDILAEKRAQLVLPVSMIVQGP